MTFSSRLADASFAGRAQHRAPARIARVPLGALASTLLLPPALPELQLRSAARSFLFSACGFFLKQFPPATEPAQGRRF